VRVLILASLQTDTDVFVSALRAGRRCGIRLMVNERLVDAEFFQLGVDGLGEAGFEEAHGLGAFHIEKCFQVRRGEMLHHGVVREIAQDFFAAGFGDVFGDENEMQLALVGPQGIPARDQ